MKTVLLLGWFYLIFSFSVFGQVDSMVVREVDSLLKVSYTFLSKRDFDKSMDVNATAEKLAFEKLGRESAMYANVCFNYGRIYASKTDRPTAIKWFLEAKTVRENVLGKVHQEYAFCLAQLGLQYWYMGNYEEAESQYLEARPIIEQTLGKEHREYANILTNTGLLYWKMGLYEKAEPLYLESLAVREKLFGKKHGEYARAAGNLAILYWAMGAYEKAEPLYLEALYVLEMASGKEQPDYARMLNNLGNLYQLTGEYEKAEKSSREAVLIAERTLGKEHPEYAQILHNLAVQHWQMGNYEKVEQLYLESKTIWEKTVGKDHPDYAQSLHNLATLYANTNPEKAERLYQEAAAIRGKVLGKDHPDYASSLSNLANLYQRLNQFDKAKALQLEAKTIREKTLGKEHPDYAGSLSALATIYRDIGEYEKAEPLHFEAASIWEKGFGKKHPKYALGLHNLATLYWNAGKLPTIKPYLTEASAIDKALLVEAARHLSEREMAAYIAKFTDSQNKMYSLACLQPDLETECYDNVLFYKGFLLNVNSRINKLSAESPLIADTFLRLKAYHRRLAAQYAKPAAERAQIAELEEKANTLEKELIRSVAGFGEALRQVNWQEVQAALQPGEAAIEFIHFRYHRPNPTDSILFAALLLKPGMSSPVFIPLFEEKQLAALITPLANQNSGDFNDLYAGQSSQHLYRLLWSPIARHLADIKTVYYSPSGLLHRLYLGAIAEAKGAVLADRYELVCLGSTRQLTNIRRENTFVPGANTTAVVYGGIQFDMDSTAYAVPSNWQNTDVNNRRGLSFAQSDSTLRGDAWHYLKWSEKEADNVQNILIKAGIAAETRKAWQATEESFKLLGNLTPAGSPRILHVSTHGFFFPDPKSDAQTGARSADLTEPVFKISDHPMMRSGLLLAGGNHAWKTGKPLGNREDGILTAYEISQLDLRNTELVVLSACETGLGQIEGNEGVYGLQRAFKIAGVKYLLMSLWQVPDYQTQELMTAFYRHLLGGNRSARQALHEAQRDMRQKRYEPFYWAGFVLVE